MMDIKTEKVLISLLNDEITFLKATQLLKISEKKLEELVDNFNWVPSLKKMIDVSKLERKSISSINEIIDEERHSQLKHSSKKKLEFSVKTYSKKSTMRLPCLENYTVGQGLFIDAVSMSLQHEDYGMGKITRLSEGEYAWN